MVKKGLIISPYLLQGFFEVDVSKINSREPLCYAYGELLARLGKDDKLCQDMIKFIKESLENTDEEIKKTGAYSEGAAVYAGFKEYDGKNPKTKIIKQEKIKVKQRENQYFWIKKSYNLCGQVLGKWWYFFKPMLIEEPMRKETSLRKSR